MPLEHNGTAHKPDQSRIAAERAALRAMCQGAEGRPLGDEGMRLLNGYRFQDLTHQVVFDTLKRIPTNLPETIRQQLQRRLALGGFPDLDAQEFFEPHGLGYQEALALIQSLAELSQETPP